MVSFKVHVEQSHTHWKRKNIKGGRMFPMESLDAPKIILGVLGLYKPSAPGLSQMSQSFSETRFE
jgi:hypothetical protein